jgi:N-acetylneuraminate synthase
MKRIFEKSIVAARDLPEGTILAEADLAFKKPGDGIPAALWRSLLGRRTTRPLAADHKLTAQDLS